MQHDIESYIWDSLEELSHLFPFKVADKLRELKEANKKADFNDDLSLIFGMNDTILENIENEYRQKLEGIQSIDDMILLLKKYPYSKEYIEKANEWIDESVVSEEMGDLLNSIGYVFHVQGNYAEALLFYEKSLKIIEKVFGENHNNTATSYNNLAELYQSQGEYDKALPLYLKALKIREERLGEKHPDTATLYANLAGFYQSQGEYKKAELLYLKDLKICEEILGEHHPSTATSYNNLADLYYTIGEYKKAELFYLKGLKIREDVLGENHPDTATSYANLAGLYRSQGEYKKAESLYLKALKVLGEKHPKTAILYSNLAELYHTMGKYEKVELLYLKGLKIAEEVLGEKHPDTATLYVNLAELYQSQEEYKKAELLYLKGIKIKEERLGEKHPDTATSYVNLANLYSAMSKYEKIEPLYLKALKIFEEKLGKNHLSTAISYANLAGLYQSQGEYDKALPLYEKALKIFEKILGDSHPSTFIIYGNIVDLYKNLLKENLVKDKFDEVETQFDKYQTIQGRLNFIGQDIGIKPYIKKIDITNFKLLQNFTIEFNDKINIIIGENSSGKTSLLQAITLALLDKNVAIETGKNPYNQYITKDAEDAKIIIKMDRFEKEIELNKASRKVKNNFLSPFVLSYSSSIFTKYGEVESLIEKLLAQKVYEDFTKSIFTDYIDTLYNPKAILNALKDEDTERANEVKNIFVEKINSFLATLDNFELVEDNSGKYCFRDKKKKEFTLKELSEGYRNSILLIGDILIKVLGVGKTPDTIEGIILIDEFDRHLHPKWQSDLVSKLTEIFPKIQFILTTHNPMSIMDRKAEEITVIREIDGELKAIRKSGTQNIDVCGILLEYFGVDTIVGDTMQKNLKEITKIKLKGRRNLTPKDKIRVKEIEEELQHTPATDFIYNRAYLNFLIFLKENKQIDFDDFESMKNEEMVALLEEYKGLF